MKVRILFITLSNIGDAILTFPVLDRIKNDFPDSSITVLSSLRAEPIFSGNPFIDRVIIYDKKSSLKDKVNLFFNLSRENFNLVVDLKDTFLGFLLRVQRLQFNLSVVPGKVRHMKDRHLYRAGYKDGILSDRRYFYISSQDKEYISELLANSAINLNDKVFIIAPGARSHTKRWPKEKFAELALNLIKNFNAKIILAGDKEDLPISQYINWVLNGACLDLTGKTTLRQLACLLERANLVISNDSAIMHMASYFDIPTVGIFGITDDTRYGPWSKRSASVKKELYCRPCQKAQCRFKTLACINLINVNDVLNKITQLLSKSQKIDDKNRYTLKRILVIRTDRIGDVILSTPAMRALRQRYPDALIAAMVSPYTKEIVEGSPFLDEVIVYDKELTHKGWLSTLRFAFALRQKMFDAALVLHPTNRVHLIAFLAGIPKRVGYNKKLGFLLTDKVEHLKQLGEKHELEYSLDLAGFLDAQTQDKTLFMPIKSESEKWAEGFIEGLRIRKEEGLLIINPSASCPSKIWPPERFAEVADILAKRYGLKVIIVTGALDSPLAEKVIKNMHAPAISLAGKISLSQLASILKRASLFISNDSGPVHICSALNVPVISIFGRSQAGLSPRRWGPVGVKDKALHKQVGCVECLAHNCKRGFACLNAITVSEVVSCASSILKYP